MTPLWKIRSGTFAGYRSGDALYDADGKNVGYFIGDVAYALNGDCLGEIYDKDWIGNRSGVMHGCSGSRVGYAGIAAGRYANRGGIALAGWSDPKF
jgi:4-fold beta-flower domain-containing protein